jgi:hypothetical protein
MSKVFETKNEIKNETKKRNPILSFILGIIAAFIVVGISLTCINDEVLHEKQKEIEQLQIMNTKLAADLDKEKHKSIFKKIF